MPHEPSNSYFSRLRLQVPLFQQGDLGGNVNIVTYVLLPNYLLLQVLVQEHCNSVRCTSQATHMELFVRLDNGVEEVSAVRL